MTCSSTRGARNLESCRFQRNIKQKSTYCSNGNLPIIEELDGNSLAGILKIAKVFYNI